MGVHHRDSTAHQVLGVHHRASTALHVGGPPQGQQSSPCGGSTTGPAQLSMWGGPPQGQQSSPCGGGGPPQGQHSSPGVWRGSTTGPAQLTRCVAGVNGNRAPAVELWESHCLCKAAPSHHLRCPLRTPCAILGVCVMCERPIQFGFDAEVFHVGFSSGRVARTLRPLEDAHLPPTNRSPVPSPLRTSTSLFLKLTSRF